MIVFLIVALCLSSGIVEEPVDCIGCVKEFMAQDGCDCFAEGAKCELGDYVQDECLACEAEAEAACGVSGESQKVELASDDSSELASDSEELDFDEGEDESDSSELDFDPSELAVGGRPRLYRKHHPHGTEYWYYTGQCTIYPTSWYQKCHRLFKNVASRKCAFWRGEVKCRAFFPKPACKTGPRGRKCLNLGVPTRGKSGRCECKCQGGYKGPVCEKPPNPACDDIRQFCCYVHKTYGVTPKRDGKSFNWGRLPDDSKACKTIRGGLTAFGCHSGMGGPSVSRCPYECKTKGKKKEDTCKPKKRMSLKEENAALQKLLQELS